MSIELVDAQFLRLLGFVDCQRSFSSSVQANAGLALAATKVASAVSETVEDEPFPTDFVLSSRQSAAVQVGVDIATYANQPLGRIWIAKHSLGWIQWLFVKSWFLIRSWALGNEQEAIRNLRNVLIFVLRAQVGTSGDDQSFDRCLLSGFIDFATTVMQPEVVRWPHVMAASERTKKVLVTFKEDAEELYARVRAQEVSKFSQPITKKRVLHFLNQCFEENHAPHQVFAFIQQLWIDVLIRIQLKEGLDSALWKEVQGVTQSLSRIFVPERREKEDFCNCHKLKPLCSKFGNTQDDAWLAKVTDVQNLVLGVLYGDPPPADMELLRFRGERDPWSVAATAKNEQALKVIRSLKPGQWIFVPGESEGHQLQQLLVVVEEVAYFVFVNKGGVALRVSSLLELIEKLQANELQIVGEDVVFASHAKELVAQVFDTLLGDNSASLPEENKSDVGERASELAQLPRSKPISKPELEPEQMLAPMVVEEAPLESPAMKAARRTLSQLSVGDWVELLIEGRGMTRCKLSVRLPSVKRCSFVSALGVAVADMHDDDLARYYVDGNLRLVQDEAPETLAELIGNRPVDSEDSFE